MNRLLIVSDNAPDYAAILEAAGLPNLEIATAENADAARALIPACNIAMGDPYMIRDVIAAATASTSVISTKCVRIPVFAGRKSCSNA